MTDKATVRPASGDSASWFLASARERIAGLLDPGSFTEFLPPSDRVQSPHLALFDLRLDPASRRTRGNCR